MLLFVAVSGWLCCCLRLLFDVFCCPFFLCCLLLFMVRFACSLLCDGFVCPCCLLIFVAIRLSLWFVSYLRWRSCICFMLLFVVVGCWLLLLVVVWCSSLLLLGVSCFDFDVV